MLQKGKIELQLVIEKKINSSNFSKKLIKIKVKKAGDPMRNNLSMRRSQKNKSHDQLAEQIFAEAKKCLMDCHSRSVEHLCKRDYFPGKER